MKDCDPQNKENIRGKACLSWLAALEEFPAHGTDKKPGRFPELRWIWTSRETKVTKVHRIEYWGERVEYREITEDLHKIHLEYSAEDWSVNAFQKTTWGWEQNQVKGLEEAVTAAYTRPEMVPIFAKQTEKNS